MVLPITLLNDLKAIPRDRPVALLMRHSARFPITDPVKMFEVPLTEAGVQMAEELGELLGDVFPCGRLIASPVGRCLATADAIARGAGWPLQAEADERISHPAIEPAWDALNRGEINGILPAPVRAALSLLLGDFPQTSSALDIMVTHDTVVGTLAGCLLKSPVTGPHWPGFLEGIFLWRTADGVHILWRGEEKIFPETFISMDAVP